MIEKSKKLEINVVCIRSDDGFGEEAFMTMKRLIQNSRPDKYEFLNPGTFMVYFKSKSKGEHRSEELIKAIENNKETHPCLTDTAIGSARGEMVASLSLFGKIIQGPYGDAGNKALNQAKAGA